MIKLTLPTCNVILKGTKRHLVHHPPLKTKTKHTSLPTIIWLQTPEIEAMAPHSILTLTTKASL